MCLYVAQEAENLHFDQEEPIVTYRSWKYRYLEEIFSTFTKFSGNRLKIILKIISENQIAKILDSNAELTFTN